MNTQQPPQIIQEAVNDIRNATSLAERGYSVRILMSLCDELDFCRIEAAYLAGLHGTYNE